MTTEISRVPYGSEPNVNIVQRVRNGRHETLKETVNSTGEEIDPENDCRTVETITITRVIGAYTQF